MDPGIVLEQFRSRFNTGRINVNFKGLSHYESVWKTWHAGSAALTKGSSNVNFFNIFRMDMKLATSI
jgi:hypothetical protein